MLKISEFASQIDSLHEEGKTALEISKLLGFKYHQPVYNYFIKRGWKRLSRQEYNMKTKYSSMPTYFDSIDTEDKAYILGFVCADGHVCSIHNRITITLKETDIDILNKIKHAMSCTHPIKVGICKRNPYLKSKNRILKQCSLSINGKSLVAPLIKMGIAGKKTYTLDGSICEYVPNSLMRHFLRGYFDGDGNAVWGKHYSSGYKYLIQVIGNKDFLIKSFQRYFPSACGLCKDSYSKQAYTWKIANKKEVLKFLNYLYSDATIYLDRKYKVYQYAMWSFKTELIAGNSSLIELLEGQSAANPLVKCLRQVQRLADETIINPFEEEIEYNSATNAQHQKLQENSDEDIVRTTQ